MNIFEEALKNCDDGMRNCIFCDQKFKPDNRNLKRGWGLSCSKKCASNYRTKMKYLNPSERKKELRRKKLRQLGI